MAITFVASGTVGTSSSGSTVGPTYPTGLASGDIIVLTIRLANAGGPGSWTLPSGFTHAAGSPLGGPNLFDVFAWKLSNGTESGTATCTWSAGSIGGCIAQMVAFRGCNQTSPIGAYSGYSTTAVVGAASSFGPAPPVNLRSGQVALVIGYAGMSWASTSFSGGELTWASAGSGGTVAGQGGLVWVYAISAADTDFTTAKNFLITTSVAGVGVSTAIMVALSPDSVKDVFLTTGTGSDTPPANTTAVRMETVGGGGGTFSGTAAAAGGQGAQWARTNSIACTSSDTIFWSVGTGGAGNNASQSNGTTSWARKNTNSAPVSTTDGCLADLGNGASARATASTKTQSGVGDVTNNGGAGANGQAGGGARAGSSGGSAGSSNTTGTAGNAGASTTPGAATTTTAGPTQGGIGGVGNAAAVNAANGAWYGGGGGGGGSSSGVGSAGAAGYVRLLYTIVPPTPMGFNLYDWPDPRGGVFPSDNRTWAFSFPLELIGKDSMTVSRGITLDQPNPRVSPPTNVNRGYEKPFPLMLRGKDAMTVAFGMEADQPNPIPPRTWVNRGFELPMPFELRGADAMATVLGMTADQPNPLTPRTWINRDYKASFPLMLRGQDAMTTVLGQTADQPNPQATRSYLNRDFTLRPALSLGGQDATAAANGMQDDQPNPLTPRTWINRDYGKSFPLMLIGQDATAAAQGMTDDQPNPLTPKTYINRDFEKSFPLMLIGQDAMATVLGQTDDQPNPQLPRSYLNRDFTLRPPLSLGGQDAMTAQQGMTDDQPNPRGPQARNLEPGPSPFLTLQVVIAPFTQFDWPNPRGPAQRPDFTLRPPLSLGGQDATAAAQGMTDDQPNPQATRTWILRDFSAAFPLMLISQDAMTAGRGATPDQPNPQAPRSYLNRSFERSFFLGLIGQDAMTTSRGQTPDQPNPAATRSYLWRDFSASFPLELIGQDQLAFRQSDWPLPRVSARLAADAGQPSFTATSFIVAPFGLSDWPNPRGYVRLIEAPIPRSPLINGADVIAFRQSDWPNPSVARRPIFDAGAPINFTQPPFALLDWPNPRAAAFPVEDRTFTGHYLLELIGQDALPFRQSDWVDPPGRKDRIDSLTWVSSFPLMLIGQDALPFRQSDWPVTRGAVRLNPEVGFFPSISFVVKPFGQSDWPNPRAAALPIDIRTWLDRTKIQLIGKDAVTTGTFRDQPNPRVSPPTFINRDFTLAMPFALRGRDAMIASRPRDWPNPQRPPLPQQHVGTAALTIYSVIRPFSQYDWPTPSIYTRPPLRADFPPIISPALVPTRHDINVSTGTITITGYAPFANYRVNIVQPFNKELAWSNMIYGKTVNFVAYDPNTLTLEVVYTNGGVVFLTHVPQTIRSAMFFADDMESYILSLVAVST